ncbi:MAG: hypothetical protein KDA44_11395 [Planctomycetales bacterium]|nr:hypothetical protein [Planctomycetales bacterium]
MQPLRPYLAASIALLALAALAAPAAAQVRRYQPSTPTVSPYLNLTRQNNSGLPNYYGLVRPQLNQQAFNQRQLRFEASQARSLSQLRTDVQTSLTPTGKGAGFMTVDRAGPYLNTGGYFPPVQNAGRR